MPTRLHLSCGGCDAEAYSEPIRTTLQAVVPAGWVMSDPYTRCTYCPSCWESIIEASAPEPENDMNTDVALGRNSRPDVISGA